MVDDKTRIEKLTQVLRRCLGAAISRPDELWRQLANSETFTDDAFHREGFIPVDCNFEIQKIAMSSEIRSGEPIMPLRFGPV